VENGKFVFVRKPTTPIIPMNLLGNESITKIIGVHNIMAGMLEEDARWAHF